MPNVRIRGKIRRDEWPTIVSRFQSGETLTEIARSYGCTAPAIRYIVARASARGAKGKTDRDKSPRTTAPSSSAENPRAARIGSSDDRSHSGRGRGNAPPDAQMGDIWGRINTDIATFLAAMDALSSDDSDGNYEALLAATDRLLWASARTRLELERVLSNRKRGTPVRRITG